MQHAALDLYLLLHASPFDQNVWKVLSHPLTSEPQLKHHLFCETFMAS